MARNAVDPWVARTQVQCDLGRRCPLPGTPDGQEGRLHPKAGRPSVTTILTLEEIMAGYGLFVLILAVGTATAGYFWMRND